MDGWMSRPRRAHHRRVCEDRQVHPLTPLCVTVFFSQWFFQPSAALGSRLPNGFFGQWFWCVVRTKAAWADKSCSQVIDMMGWVRARLSVALARSASLCVRGGRRRWKIRQAWRAVRMVLAACRCAVSQCLFPPVDGWIAEGGRRVLKVGTHMSTC